MVMHHVWSVLDRYAVNFVPRESGLHYVHVKLNGVHVPGSPYPVQVGRVDADASQVRAYGDGLYKGFTGMTHHTCLYTLHVAMPHGTHMVLYDIVFPVWVAYENTYVLHMGWL